MSDNITKVYAKAIFNILQDNPKSSIMKDFESFNELVNKSSDLEQLLFFDSFSIKEKEDVISNILKRDMFSDYFSNFLLILLRNKRINLFTEIYKELERLDNYSKGFVKGRLEYASKDVPLEITQKITRFLEQQLGKKVVLNCVENKNILAGAHAIVGDLMIDATIEHQFDLLKNM